MTQDKLNNITNWIKENIIQNPDIMFEDTYRGCTDDQPIDVVEVIASLHNELYKEVTGEYYDYCHHWANKIGANIDDKLFKNE